MGRFVRIISLLVLSFIALSTSALPVLAKDYILGPGDNIEVTLWALPDLSTTTIIKPDGYITLPLVNDIKLDGLTTAEAKDKVTNAFSVYVKEPKVTITLKDVRAINVQVMGVVKNPGMYSMPGNEARILGAVAKAGGCLDNSDTSKVLLTHRGDNQSATVDLDLAEKDSQYDVAISDGDTIIVPFIDRSATIHGEVTRPGKYPVMKNGSRLNDIIALAGGITDKADLSKVVVSVNGDKGQADSSKTETVLFRGDASKNPLVPEGAIIQIPPGEAIQKISRVTPYLQVISLVVTVITAIIGLTR